MKTLAVFGGTFNPFHIGHMQMLSQLEGAEWIDKVLVMPSKIPPHKKVDFLASDKNRVTMCTLATEGFNKATVSDIELSREGKSYTVDTVSVLKEIYPEYKIYITIGGDMLTSFTEWRDYKKIIKQVGLIVFGRSTTKKDDFDTAVDKLLGMGAEIKIIDDEIIGISSSELRNAMNNKAFLKTYLPDKIYDYILENRVYGD